MTLKPSKFPLFLRDYLVERAERKTDQKLETQYLRTLRRKLNLDQFTIINTIGKGAFSLVYLVRDNLNKKLYALKALTKSQEKTQIAAKLERDIMLKMEKSPFLVSLKASFQDHKNFYILMEFCQGGDLMGLMMRMHVLPEQQMKFYASEIINAIQEVHQANFLYLDLKPDNVLITKEGHIKLADFNLSRSNHDDQKIQGTLDYMAPEMLLKQKITSKSDVWSIGAVIYEGVIGRVPFSSETKQETAKKIVKFDINYPNTISSELQSLFEQIFTSEDKRISISEMKMHPFFNGVVFEDMLEIKPPFIPVVKDTTDLKYFDAVGIGFESGKWWGEIEASKGEFTYKAFPGSVQAEQKDESRVKIDKLFDKK